MGGSEAVQRPGALLVAGNLVFDILAGPVEELIWDGTVWPQNFAEGLGGNGAVTATAAAMLGAEVHLVTAVGDDSHGAACRTRLHQAGVQTCFIQPETGPTPFTMGLFRSGGSRALVHRPGVMREAFADLESLAPLAPPHTAHLHIANPFGVPALRQRAPAYLAEARSLGWTTSLDTGWDKAGEWMQVIGPCLPWLDYLFTNQPESLALTANADPAAAARLLQAGGASRVILKLGPQGCLWLPETGIAEIHGAYSVDALDSTGAGDCFCGGFLAALVQGETYRDALRLANACGALSVSMAGATTGLLDGPATQAWIAARPR